MGKMDPVYPQMEFWSKSQDVRRASHVVKYIQRKAHDRQLALENKEGEEERKESISNL